jgi:DNA end-binding protein Ku
VKSKTSTPATGVVDLMSALAASVARTSGKTAQAPATSARNDTVDLQAMTKTRLLRLASDYDIPGRTKMSKAELVSALTEAGAANPDQRATA